MKFFLNYKLWGGLLLLAPIISEASDIVRGLQSANEAPDYTDGGYFELGVIIGAATDTFQTRESGGDDRNTDDDVYIFAGFVMGGAYRYKGVFFEFAQGSFDGLNLGYTVWTNRNWSVDILASSLSGTTGDDPVSEDDTEEQRNEKLRGRRNIYSGAGLRLTGYIGDYIVQYRLVTDTYKGNGVTSSLRVGHNWQYRNWNFHTLGGLVFNSKKTNQYRYSIDAEEATSRFPQYDAGSNWDIQFAAGVDYPVGENWVFRSSLTYSRKLGDINDSPLINRDDFISFSNSLSYVF